MFRYNKYVRWFLKNGDGDLNLRLSPKKLETRSNRGQHIIIMRKHHPWMEEINLCILLLEVILMPYSIIIIVNPTLGKWNPHSLGRQHTKDRCHQES